MFVAKWVFQAYRALHFDIVLGALATSYYFTSLTNIHLPFTIWICLGLSVWFIYGLDAYLDHKREPIPSKRNAAFLKYIPLLLVVNAVVLIVLLPGFLRHMLFWIGCGSIGMFLYFILNQWQTAKPFYFFPRELIIVLIYLYGTVILPMQTAETEIAFPYLHVAGYFFLLLCNVLYCSLSDIEEDNAWQVKSFPLVTGIRATEWLGILSGLLALLIFIFLLIHKGFAGHGVAGVLMALMLILLQIKGRKEGVWGHVAFADAVLLLPFSLQLFR